MKTKAILIGASGRVGQALARQLSALYETVILVTRTQPAVMSANMHIYHVPDFQSLPTIISGISIGADTDAFSCLGVAKSQVASMDEFYQVNVLYNLEFAKACCDKGVSRFFYLSKEGADQPTGNDELIAKADVEYYLGTLGFDELVVFRLGKLTAPKLTGLPNISTLFGNAKQAIIDAITPVRPLTPEQVASSIALVAYRLSQQAAHEPKQPVRIISHARMRKKAGLLN